MQTQDLFMTKFFVYQNPQVENLLRNEGFEYELTELSNSILEIIDIAKFQTRHVDGCENFVDRDRVDEFVETIKCGDPLPACILFFINNKYIALDGRHRIEAHKIANSSSFVAYVIKNADESKIFRNGLRLSNLINDMNGERAGKDEEERKQKKVAIDLCVNEMFELLVTKAVSEDIVKKEIPKKYKLNKSSHVKNAMNLLSHRIVSTQMIAATQSQKRGIELANGIGALEVQAAQNIISRCEPKDKIKIVETIIAAKNHELKSNKVRDILVENKSNPPSEIIKTLQAEAGLNENNIKLQVAERAHQVKQVDLKRSIGFLGKQLTFKTAFYGAEKAEVIKQLNILVVQIKSFISFLETI